MSTTMQIFLGAVLLGLCSLIHILMLVAAVRFIARHAHHLGHLRNGMRWTVLLVFAFLTVILAHTIQVWSWAFAFVGLGAIDDISRAIYFSLVTYTTVGYGDVTVGPHYGIFGAMASVAGLLNFGLSTAFLVGLFTRMLEEDERAL
jgi:Ion channel